MSMSPAFAVETRTNRKTFSRRASSGMIASLIIMVALVFTGCGDMDDNDTNTADKPTDMSSQPSKGLIKADPNPVPPGGKELGKTTISWNTQSPVEDVYVFVSTNNEPEVQFASGGQEGSAEAPWIQTAGVYDFRLYTGTGANRQLIDHVQVTRK